jgi:general secretion pathway protein D
MRSAQSGNELTLDRYRSIRAVQEASQPQQRLLLPDTGAPVLPEPTISSPSKALPQPSLQPPPTPQQPPQQPQQQPPQ